MAVLNLHHLRLFRAVARDGTLTGAAQALNLSQSALSTQIKSLEAMLGHALFERRGRGLVLTEAGRIALDHAESIFRTAEDLTATLRNTGTARRPLRVGALATLSRNFQMEFLTPLIGRTDVELVLRSGTERRRLTAFASFDSTWARGGRWAVLTLPAGELPARPALRPWLKAASDLEETGHGAAAQRAYRTATQQWPEESLGWFALANSYYASGDKARAEEAMRTSLARQPDFAAGWFNLSQLLGERGCRQAAAQAQRCARRLEPGEPRFAMLAESAPGATGQCAAPPVCPLTE